MSNTGGRPRTCPHAGPHNVADAGRPLDPLVGSLWVPIWAVRPGSYLALRDLAAAMQLWLAIYSRDPDYMRPCYASRETLGKTLGLSRATVGRQLAALRDASLIFEVERGQERKSRRHRPPARWAIDPLYVETRKREWRPRVETALREIAEEDGQDGRWYHNAMTALAAFERRSLAQRNVIAKDMPVHLRPKRRRKGKRKKGGEARDSGPRPNLSRGLISILEGRGLPGVGLGVALAVVPDPSATNGRDRKHARDHPSCPEQSSAGMPHADPRLKIDRGSDGEVML